ncbi:MAG: LysE family transporter [Chloroflexota bacterium]
MTAFLPFLFEAVLISLSGVLAPGPITALAVARGSRSPHAGAWIAMGHGIVEFPVMAGVFLGVGQLLQLPLIRPSINALGAAVLVYMGVSLLRLALRPTAQGSADHRSPLAAGVLLTAANPYFLLWWATVGAALVMKSITFGLLGFVSFGLAHWLCDFGWCTLLSVVSHRGKRLLGGGFQRAVLLVCSFMLFLFAGRMLVEVWNLVSARAGG